jgi:flagellar assembly protein FliH
VAKTVFRPGEVVVTNGKVFLNPPQDFPDWARITKNAQVEEAESDEEKYTGPTAADLQKEADDFRAQWEIEKEKMIAEAREEAEAIRKEAEEAAFNEVKRRTGEAQTEKQKAEDEAARIIKEAEDEAEAIRQEARTTFDAGKREAEDEARKAGREEGYREGSEEVQRLIERLRTMLDRAQDKRAEILAETEQQVIDLSLLIARKVIKVITEGQRNIVISNVIQALRKVKSRGVITIRVNLADLKLTSEHTADFIKQVEGARSIQVVEDSRVDTGGCIIETDYGEIDARISSQLAEIEAKILEISPVKEKVGEQGAGNREPGAGSRGGTAAPGAVPGTGAAPRPAAAPGAAPGAGAAPRPVPGAAAPSAPPPGAAPRPAPSPGAVPPRPAAPPGAGAEPRPAGTPGSPGAPGNG